MNDFQTGHWGWGIAHSLLAVSDVFLVKSIFTGIAKLVVEAAVDASVEVSSETGIKYSDELVESAQELYPNKAGNIELHHITPKYLGGPVDGPLVPLDAAYHQVITNEFRSLWPYGIGKPSSEELGNIMNQVYSKYPLPTGYGF